MKLELASGMMSFLDDFALTHRDSGMKAYFGETYNKAVHVFRAVFTDHLLCAFYPAEVQLELWEVTDALKEFIILLGSLRCKKKY